MCNYGWPEQWCWQNTLSPRIKITNICTLFLKDMQNLGEISNVLYKCLSQINYIKGKYKLRMFIYIAAYYNYYTSNDMHIKILFLNNSLTIYSTPFELYPKPPLALLNCQAWDSWGPLSQYHFCLENPKSEPTQISVLLLTLCPFHDMIIVRRYH